ncbi:MarR family transcriptional regulator [Bacterioplanes sanyensis]|uniref:MarR family transcriptional regulator n=1 Tax=Bacterioplanes sanyensis TaxID=1249553 RepID=A0A222FIA3_9GAMM|nr:MarR family winged helix-turn-helix transcriptional regulator [Bacterioplanes sanyensis]ASP38500.1 MarR family transcriptional regulator [Bacterioplanes sanyensis]
MSVLPCYNLKLRQADRVLTNYYDDALRDSGITVAQFSILRALTYLQQPSQKALQDVLVLQQTTLTRNLKPLIRDGYVSTMPSPEDKRVTLVSLTASGKALFKTAKRRWDQVQRRVEEHLGPDLTRQLLALSDSVLELRK